MYRFSSRFEEDLPAVVSFAYQEPENDPRYFGYLWVVRGPAAMQSMFVSHVILIPLSSSARLFVFVRGIKGSVVFQTCELSVWSLKL